MYQLKFYKKAVSQYTQIGQYIAEDNPYYAHEVLQKIDASIELLLTYPFIGTEIIGTPYRKIVEPSYKYKIIYKVQNTNIIIVGIFREQKYWK